MHNGAFTRIDLRTNQAIRFPKFGTPGKLSPYGKSSFLGVVFSMDSQKVYLSGGDAGTVLEVDVQSAKVLRTFSLDGVVSGVIYEDSFTSDLTISPSQNELLVLDRANFRMVRISLTDGTLLHSIPTGRLPFGVTLSLDQKYAFVFGNEVFGVNDAWIQEADFSLEIPQFGTKHSLNVSVSMGVVIWDFVSKIIA